MRGVRTAGVVLLVAALVAVAAVVASANPSPHIRVAAPRISERLRTITVSGATTAQFPNLRVYWEHVPGLGATCAGTFAERPRLNVEAWERNDVVPQHAVDLVSFERREAVAVGDRGEHHILCAYLVSHSGHVGARAQGYYRDPALR